MNYIILVDASIDPKYTNRVFFFGNDPPAPEKMTEDEQLKEIIHQRKEQEIENQFFDALTLLEKRGLKFMFVDDPTLHK